MNTIERLQELLAPGGLAGGQPYACELRGRLARQRHGHPESGPGQRGGQSWRLLAPERRGHPDIWL